MKTFSITTYPLTNQQIRQELEFLIQYFLKRGFVDCKILFGYAWGLEYYQDDWVYETIALADILTKINQVEQLKIGSLGYDNFYIQIAGLEFNFCDESDIHLKYCEFNDDVEFVYQRWKSLNYQPQIN